MLYKDQGRNMDEKGTAPKHILIIGAGVFGLTAALALAQRPQFKSTHLTVLDPHRGIPDSHKAVTSSVDTTRIVRGDYADPHYAQLACRALREWQKYNKLGAENNSKEQCFFNTGIVFTADAGSNDYVQKSLANTLKMEAEAGARAGGIKALRSRDEISRALSKHEHGISGTGSSGYYNPSSSWANAELAMRNLWQEVVSTGRVQFVNGRAVRLLQDQNSGHVIGAELEDGRNIADADSTIVAAGAWSPTLVDLRGIASATGQCIGYLDVTEDEERKLRDIPVHLNLGTGHFFFPAHNGEIKTARHCYGYINPVEIAAPVGLDLDRAVVDKARTITVSVPMFKEQIPSQDAQSMSTFVEEALPLLSKTRSAGSRKVSLSRSRLCWYLDTKSADFLICWHPAFTHGDDANVVAARRGSLFMATGGSGHAFKFLPVLGERIADVFDGTDLNAATASAPGSDGLWTTKWAWPKRQKEDYVWCEDGSRSGKKGLRLDDAMGTS